MRPQAFLARLHATLQGAGGFRVRHAGDLPGPHCRAILVGETERRRTKSATKQKNETKRRGASCAAAATGSTRSAASLRAAAAVAAPAVCVAFGPSACLAPRLLLPLPPPRPRRLVNLGCAGNSGRAEPPPSWSELHCLAALLECGCPLHVPAAALEQAEPAVGSLRMLARLAPSWWLSQVVMSRSGAVLSMLASAFPEAVQQPPPNSTWRLSPLEQAAYQVNLTLVAASAAKVGDRAAPLLLRARPGLLGAGRARRGAAGRHGRGYCSSPPGTVVAL